jgi:hypothetical protein
MLLCGSAAADTASSAILLAVEQRIGPIIPSVPAAGLDPAYVPGLTPPRADQDEAADAVPEQAGTEAEPREAAPEAAEPEAATAKAKDAKDAKDTAEDAEGTAEDGNGADAESTSGSAAGQDAEAEAESDATTATDTPDFEVSDRRGAIIADRVGVRFRLDEEEAEFRWDEIAAVEIDTPRFGRRFSVTVYTPERRWYDAQVEATSRGLLKEWTAQLDAVLDTYFEDEREEPEPASAEEAEPASDEGASADSSATEKPAAAESVDAEAVDAETADQAETAEEAEPAGTEPAVAKSVSTKPVSTKPAGTGAKSGGAKKAASGPRRKS